MDFEKKPRSIKANRGNALNVKAVVHFLPSIAKQTKSEFQSFLFIVRKGIDFIQTPYKKG